MSRVPVSPAMPPTGNPALRPKPLMLAAAFAGIVGLAAFVIHSNREAAPAVSPPAAERAAQPPRPALSAAEEQYIRELWPIHGDVERSTVRMSLGQIFYLTKDLSKAELGTRVKEALATYQTAEARIQRPGAAGTAAERPRGIPLGGPPPPGSPPPKCRRCSPTGGKTT